MKTGKLFKWALALFAICLVIFEMLEAGVAMAVAAASVEGTVSTEEYDGSNPDILAREIERKVLEEGRDRNPINVIMLHMKNKEKTEVLKPEYMTVSEPELVTKVTEAYAKPATPLSSITIKVANPQIFSRMNTVAILNVKSYLTDTDTIGTTNVPLNAIVTAVNADSIVLTAVSGLRNAEGRATFADNIPVDTDIICMGKAETEKAMQTDFSNEMPKTDYNYVQNFMFMLSMTDWSKLHAKNVDWGYSELFRRTLEDYKVKKELSYIFGVKSKITVSKDGKNEVVRTCDGYLSKMEKKFDVGTDITHDKMADMMQQLFDGNNGSAERYAFLGSDMYLKWEKYKGVEKRIDATSTEVKFGLTFEKVVFGGNTLFLIKHPLLAQVGFSDFGLILDMNYIYEKEFMPYTSTELKLKESGQSREEAVSVSEVCCPIVKNRDCHMLLIGS